VSKSPCVELRLITVTPGIAFNLLHRCSILRIQRVPSVQPAPTAAEQYLHNCQEQHSPGDTNYVLPTSFSALNNSQYFDAYA
jgi:hypothetical protein